jgi:hypothetical protein
VSTKTHATLRYTSMRFSLFGACFFVTLMLAHYNILPVMAGAAGVLLLLMVSLLVSGLLSYVLLSRQRDQVSQQLAGGLERIRAKNGGSLQDRIAAQNAAEDAIDDAIRAEQGTA